MRFDAPEHVQQWVSTGRFPGIHDDITTAVQTFGAGTRALDLCCSTGLLAARLKLKCGMTAVGVDADEKALQLGRDAGLPVPLLHLKVNRDTFDKLAIIIADYKLTILVARRCMPELFGAKPDDGRLFAAFCAEHGIKEIFLEGRVSTPNATNKLATLKAEVELFSMHYRAVRVHKNVAYLVAKK